MKTGSESRRKPSAIIFGAGNAGKSAYSHLSSDYDIIGFADSSREKCQMMIFNLPVYTIERLWDLNVDHIFIASEFSEQIEGQINEISSSAMVSVLPARMLKNVHFSDSRDQFELAVKIINQISNHFFREKIPFYVDGGTLLGIYRDNSLIPWDDDIDVSVKSSDIDRILVTLDSLLLRLREVTSEKWRCDTLRSEKRWGAVPKGGVRSFKLRSDNPKSALPMVDIFVKYIHGEWMDYCLASRAIRMPSHHFEQTVEREFCGFKTMIPGKTDQYLTSHYGDWKTPDKNWSLRELQSATLL